MSNNLQQNQRIEWLCIKIPFIFFSLKELISTLNSVTSISSNKGLCLLVDCNLFLIDLIKYSLVALLLVLAVLYVLEKKMIFTTLGIFCISLIAFSLHESFGVSNRTGIFTLVWFAQFLAYFFNRNTLDNHLLVKNRIYFPVQVIVACYTMSALSKIITSGFSWFTNAHLMVLQMLKSNQMESLDGTISSSEIVSQKIQFVMDHGHLMIGLLAIALLIELTSGLALLSNRMRIVYGLLLFSLHVGIDFFFDITIEAFQKTMLIFMINPVLLIYLFFKKVITKDS